MFCVGLSRCWLIGDLRSGVGCLFSRDAGVGEGVLMRRLLGEERLSGGVGEGGLGEVRFAAASSVGVGGRAPLDEPRPDGLSVSAPLRAVPV